jgi:TRAP-type mannitol/chloroaromatic compound transport system substrate-binding protein
MKRREFLKVASGGTVVTALAAPAIAQGAPEIRWRLTSSFPKSLDTIYGTARSFCDFVQEATDGRFQIQPFAAGELVPGLQALDAVSSGSIEMAQTPTYFYAAKDPVLALGTGVPFGLNARLQQAWWTEGGGAGMVNASLAKFNAIAFAAGNSGCQMGGWFRKEINAVEDLKGLKFRISGMGGDVLARLGAEPQTIAAGEIYPALERGAIDAAEFVGPYDDERLNLAEVARYYYYPGWWEGGALLHMCVNLEKWNSLPKSYQAVFRLACEAAGQRMLAKYDTVNAPALKRLVGKGAIPKPFPAPVLDACYKMTSALTTEIAAKNPSFKKALESLLAFRAEQYTWWRAAELPFDLYVASKTA